MYSFSLGSAGWWFRKEPLVVVVAMLLLAGCEQPPPVSVDVSKTPWLDPQAQMDGLKNEDFRIRGLSAFHLGNLGARAVAALPQLERLAKEDPNPKVRQNAAEAIEKIRAAAGTSSG